MLEQQCGTIGIRTVALQKFLKGALRPTQLRSRRVEALPQEAALQASQERRFLGERLDTARAELRRAEGALEKFLQRNRSYPNSPTLLFEHDRLQREAGLRQDVYSMLTQAYEQARMQAVRNTPSISLIDHPVPALRYDP